MRDLHACRFIENAENIIFLGLTGLGKTHLAIAIATEAINLGYDVKFLSLRLLPQMLDKVSDNPSDVRKLITLYSRQDLLIVDEIAMKTLDKPASDVLNEIILNRHLKHSTIFTSNKTFNNWTETFGDQHNTAMIVDRILQVAHIIDIKGESYRTKDRIIFQVAV